MFDLVTEETLKIAIDLLWSITLQQSITGYRTLTDCYTFPLHSLISEFSSRWVKSDLSLPFQGGFIEVRTES